jgi:hypothetical protein
MHGTVNVVTETIGLESGEHGEFTVLLTLYQVYGIIGFGMVALLAIAMLVGRTRQIGEQTTGP